jgi:hypothetical protein
MTATNVDHQNNLSTKIIGPPKQPNYFTPKSVWPN